MKPGEATSSCGLLKVPKGSQACHKGAVSMGRDRNRSSSVYNQSCRDLIVNGMRATAVRIFAEVGPGRYGKERVISVDLCQASGSEDVSAAKAVKGEDVIK